MSDMRILTPEEWPSDHILRINLEAYDTEVARCVGDGFYPHNAEQPTSCPTCGASAWAALLIRCSLALRAKLTGVEAERDRLRAALSVIATDYSNQDASTGQLFEELLADVCALATPKGPGHE